MARALRDLCCVATSTSRFGCDTSALHTHQRVVSDHSAGPGIRSRRLQRSYRTEAALRRTPGNRGIRERYFQTTVTAAEVAAGPVGGVQVVVMCQIPASAPVPQPTFVLQPFAPIVNAGLDDLGLFGVGTG